MYFKAKLFLVKRLIDSKSPASLKSQIKSTDSINLASSNNNNSNSIKKKFTIDRFLNFFKPNSNTDENQELQQTEQ